MSSGARPSATPGALVAGDRRPPCPASRSAPAPSPPRVRAVDRAPPSSVVDDRAAARSPARRRAAPAWRRRRWRQPASARRHGVGAVVAGAGLSVDGGVGEVGSLASRSAVSRISFVGSSSALRDLVLEAVAHLLQLGVGPPGPPHGVGQLLRPEHDQASSRITTISLPDRLNTRRSLRSCHHRAPCNNGSRRCSNGPIAFAHRGARAHARRTRSRRSRWPCGSVRRGWRATSG